MKFIFKRKYTLPFFVFFMLITIAVSFYFVGPKFIDKDQELFNQILLVSIADVLLITIFILGLYRVNYYLYHDKLEIHRSFLKKIVLKYDQIKEIREYPHDTIIFMFGIRPSFRVTYKTKKGLKNYKIRVSNHELLKLVLSNEHKIHIITNN